MMRETIDIPDKIQELYDEQQALKETQILDRDMFQDGVTVTQEDLTLHELIDRMLYGTVDLALRDDVLSRVFHRFYNALPTNEHLAIFRRKFDTEINARWPLRINNFEDLRALITRGGQHALYAYGDALFYLQQLRREDLEEKKKALEEQQETQTSTEAQKTLSDQAFEAWLAVVFILHPELLGQYQANYAAQNGNEPDNDPVSDTLATPPVEVSVMEDGTYIPDKGTQNDMVEFVHARLEGGESSSGSGPDYDENHDRLIYAPDQANDFEEAAEPEPDSVHLTHG